VSEGSVTAITEICSTDQDNLEWENAGDVIAIGLLYGKCSASNYKYDHQHGNLAGRDSPCIHCGKRYSDWVNDCRSYMPW
jgi:hypothetical protein